MPGSIRSSTSASQACCSSSLKSACPVGRMLDRVALVAQVQRDDLGDVGVVFDEQDAFRGGHAVGTPVAARGSWPVFAAIVRYSGAEVSRNV